MSAGLKRCCTCRRWLPLDEFNVRRRSVDGRQDRCRECFKAWYRANAARQVRDVREDKLRRQRAIWALMRDYLLAHPCVDCGAPDIRVLEFDHRDRAAKSANISALLCDGAPWPTILHEVSKCDDRCVNCHKRRTARQLGWWKLRFQDLT